MNTFEDKLLTELRTVVAERPVDIRRKRPKRVLVGIAACLTLAAGTAVAVPVLGSSSPAYAVTTQPDGTVQVKIYRLQEAKELEKRLKAAGVPAEVNFLPKGQTCRRTPGGKPPAGDRAGLGIVVKRDDRAATMVLHPADYRGNTLLLEGSGSVPTDRYDSPTFSLVSRVRTGTFGPCVPVDAVKLPVPLR
ncbi:hypothetical protein GCM10029976_060790 [Kribbella albertanoniae]|uniref:Uncharacterized protein n=1 Tax=Kribbella albertanoniae TaxID=1266829 RepID=A0A4R4Q3H2_9ACTN|nr:hypothetical protein [Kribbella albertanoniae]TDC29577.1 hypothetical protein E1261_15285 [Kribbella albertanoniae]